MPARAWRWPIAARFSSGSASSTTFRCLRGRGAEPPPRPGRPALFLHTRGRGPLCPASTLPACSASSTVTAAAASGLSRKHPETFSLGIAAAQLFAWSRAYWRACPLMFCGLVGLPRSTSCFAIADLCHDTLPGVGIDCPCGCHSHLGSSPLVAAGVSFFTVPSRARKETGVLLRSGARTSGSREGSQLLERETYEHVIERRHEQI